MNPALRYRDDDITSFQSQLTANVRGRLDMWSIDAVPFLQLAYIHEFENDSRDIRALVVRKPPDQQISYRTNTPDRDYFAVETSLSLQISSRWTIFGYYERILGHDRQEQSAFGIGAGASF
jgi:outer membrane lipase/esterase